ncbi:hypothetical protein, partial [Kitasatospora sp. LaBMicrA B282]|uniref:hypothetical protein n=1 Tax=Kitasatospora sp. LaBMicrA B282 TaxID=3420949 RepID=UPI003D1056C2
MTIRRSNSRAAAAALLGAAALLAAAPLAQADAPAPAAVPAPAVLPQSDLGAARAAVQAPAVQAELGAFFARGGVPPTQPLPAGAAAQAAPAPQAAQAPQADPAARPAPRLIGATVPVYTLDPGFVAGTAGAPVARVDFTATEAQAADGRTASVWAVQQNGSWKVVNIASGSDETDYAAAGAAGGGGTVFREPQINAWYVLRGGRVLPLDAEARSSVGTGGVGLAAYQRLVHQRYGDKLPGSAYDRAGLGGGFSATAPTGSTAAGTTTAGRTAAAPQPHDGLPVAAVTAAAALGATALTGVGLALRRRRPAG